jgi:non-ribosomal peptide synthetase component F
VDERQGAAEWLSALQSRQVEQRQYEYSPLADVQKWSEVEAGRALFESLLVFENFPVDPSARPPGDLQIRSPARLERTNYPLLVLALPGDRFRFHLVYDRSRFDDAAIERMESHLTRIVTALAAGLEAPVGELPLLATDEERALAGWNETAAAWRRDRTIPELFREQAAVTPDAVAVASGGDSLTYRALAARVDALAARLRALGVGPEARVGVCLQRSLDLPVALLGAMQAGGAYVPLDPAYPSERLAFMVRDAGVQVLLTEESLRDVVPAGHARVLCLDGEGAGPPEDAPSAPARAPAPDNLAYLIYTSGSTGTP